MTKSTKLINELFDNYVSNYLTSYGSPYLTLYIIHLVICYRPTCAKNYESWLALDKLIAIITPLTFSRHLKRLEYRSSKKAVLGISVGDTCFERHPQVSAENLQHNYCPVSCIPGCRNSQLNRTLHSCTVAYSFSAGTEISDLGWPWTAITQSVLKCIAYSLFQSPPRKSELLWHHTVWHWYGHLGLE